MCFALFLIPASEALAQNATVTLGSQKQFVRGFGGMVHIPWAGDLSASERTLAFGNADGQLGLTVLRIAVPDGNTSDTSYVATAKAAIAAGGIVFASPWNSSGSMNSSDFASYASHLSGFASTMKGQGAELFAIGTQNEPDYATQSGWKAWTAAQCHDFMASYGDKVGTKLITCESFNYSKGLYDPILNDSAAVEKMGVLGTHLYGTSVSGYAYPLFDSKGAGKERWMTEHYTDSNTDANAWPNALGVASELHNSMVTGQFNAYTWWYIKRSYGFINNGAITKRGWCMAHWSKFVRPGFYRVDATEKPVSGVSLSAYKNDTDVVIIAVNTGSSAASVNISIAGSSIASFDKYTTSSSKSMASDGKVSVSGGSMTVSLDGSGVTTLRGTGSGSPLSGMGGSSGGGGSTGGGSDAGRDARAPAGDTAGSGMGGVTGRDAGSSNRDASGTGGVAGGAVGSGGAAVAGASGSGLGSGGIASGAGGGSGGAQGAGGASAVTGEHASQGCQVSGPAGGPSVRLAPFIALLMLACLVRRRRRG